MAQSELETRRPARLQAGSAAAGSDAAELIRIRHSLSTAAAPAPQLGWFDRLLPRLLSPLHHAARRAMILTTHRSAAAKLAKRGEGGGDSCLFCRLSAQAREEAGLIGHAAPAAPVLHAAAAAAADDAKEPEAEEEAEQAGVVLQAPPLPETDNDNDGVDERPDAGVAKSQPRPLAPAAASAPAASSEAHTSHSAAAAAASSCFLPAPDPPAASNRFLYSDALVYVVRDAHPAARVHLLVLPHAHIRDCLSLRPPDAALAAHMQTVASLMLSRLSPDPLEAKRTGFHVPPYISQPHLHLHVLAGAFAGCCARRRGCKGCCRACAPPCDCVRIKYTAWCCWYRPMHEVQRRLDEAAAAGSEQQGEGGSLAVPAEHHRAPAQPNREKMES